MGISIHTIAQVRDGRRWRTVSVDTPSSRNYNTFAIFAGVGNSDTWEIITPLRGLPEDCEPYFSNRGSTYIEVPTLVGYGRWCLGTYGHTWLTLKEIQKHAESLGEWKELSGYVTQEEAEWLKSGQTTKPLESFWLPIGDAKGTVKATWRVRVDDLTDIGEYVSELTQIGDDVRLVLGFS